jgi:tRNA threonylcarbamoyladenosine biosynthesis protein TsaB
MNLLAFDTSTTACSVSLLKSEALFSQHKVAPMQQAALILPMIEELLKNADLSLAELDAIAFGCGPGSFTGIRIASSVAQGISFAYSLPIIQISSLAVIAQAAYDERQWSQLMVAVDARMEQVYWATYAVNQQGLVELIGQETACDPLSVPMPKNEGLTQNLWYGVGDAWECYKDQLIGCVGFQPVAIAANQAAHAAAMIKLAKAQLESGTKGITAALVAPVYLR